MASYQCNINLAQSENNLYSGHNGYVCVSPALPESPVESPRVSKDSWDYSFIIKPSHLSTADLESDHGCDSVVEPMDTEDDGESENDSETVPLDTKRVVDDLPLSYDTLKHLYECSQKEIQVLHKDVEGLMKDNQGLLKACLEKNNQIAALKAEQDRMKRAQAELVKSYKKLLDEKKISQADVNFEKMEEDEEDIGSVPWAGMLKGQSMEQLQATYTRHVTAKLSKKQLMSGIVGKEPVNHKKLVKSRKLKLKLKNPAKLGVKPEKVAKKYKSGELNYKPDEILKMFKQDTPDCVRVDFEDRMDKEGEFLDHNPIWNSSNVQSKRFKDKPSSAAKHPSHYKKTFKKFSNNFFIEEIENPEGSRAHLISKGKIKKRLNFCYSHSITFTFYKDNKPVREVSYRAQMKTTKGKKKRQGKLVVGLYDYENHGKTVRVHSEDTNPKVFVSDRRV